MIGDKEFIADQVIYAEFEEVLNEKELPRCL